MKISRFACISLLTLSSAAFGQQEQGPSGVSATCNTIVGFASTYRNYTPDSLVFNVKISEWTPATVAYLKAAADSCGRNIRPDFIDRAKAKIDEVAKIPEKYRASEEKKMAEESKRQRIVECEATSQNALYSAQQRVIADVENLTAWRANRSQDQRIARVSGVRDLREERNNGAWIVQTQDELKSDFAEYKRLGGKASSPQRVAHQLQDPCASLR